MLGKLAQHRITSDGETVVVETIWTGEVKHLEKVSAVAATDSWLAVGGFGKDEKGLVEVWAFTDAGTADTLAAQTEDLSISTEQK